MIVLYILLGLIALIVVVLHFSVCVYVKGGTDGELVYKVTFMGFTVFPRPEKKPKKPKSDGPPAVTGPEEETDEGEETEEKEPEEAAVEELAETELAEVPAEEETAPSEEEEPPEPKPEPKAEEKKEDKKEKKKKSKKEDSTEPEKKGGKLAELKEKYEFIKPFIPLGWKYFRKLLKAVRFTGVRVNIVTGKEDAYESAMFYGKLQIALSSVLTLLGGIFTVYVKEANVSCVFNEKRLDASGEVTVKVRPSTMIAIGFCMGVKALVIFLRQRRRKKKAEKIAAAKAEAEKKDVKDGKAAA